jgi:hypothetical protein
MSTDTTAILRATDEMTENVSTQIGDGLERSSQLSPASDDEEQQRDDREHDEDDDQDTHRRKVTPLAQG